ncbi:hypothetical protein GE061_015486 [Apolygus lucorum]|uniref:Uncharacterized protein n=1 Tax=Apolygus lucorum TaxID=248454 RepID=A0A8S9XL78_APOLU|nr:hypothetical protein GE061_015486 [Apolygus lucorum]
MDGVCPVDPVKIGATAAPSNKSHPRGKFVEPLTPLHRLARFKEIRDRNLARDRNLRKSIQPRRQSLAPSYTMDTVVNGVSRNETKLAKIKGVEKLTNGSEASSHTNGEHASNGNGLDADPVKQEEVIAKDEVVENTNKSPKRNGTEELTQDVIDPDATFEVIQESTEPPVEEKGIEEEAGNDSDSEAGHESEGSSLDVVGESSSESLDLQVSSRGSQETSGNDAGPSHIPELYPTPESEPKVVTPEIVRKIRAGGRIAARRNLRGEHSTPALKRKLDDDEEDTPSGKKARDDGTTKSPGWQFFSPSKSFSKFWAPHRSSSVDESMIVNVDGDSNIFENIDDETATTLIEESRDTRTRRWCAIM